jgi:sugar phosphate isomerase/epimerase
MASMRDLSQQFDVCSINTATLGFRADIDETIEAVAAHGFRRIAPWRREVEGGDVKAIAKHIRDAGLSLSGYCRSTYIPAANVEDFKRNVEDNKKALRDASVLGAPVFVMVVGGLPTGSKNLSDARSQVQDACGELMAYGREIGVRIGLEPLHPVYAADRSCLTLLSEALDMCDAIEGPSADPWIGVVVDCYHVWWDPYLVQNISRAGSDQRIFGFHVCDWLVPTVDVLSDRGMMGDGVIDIAGIRRYLEAAGYAGAVEVEIFSDLNWWKRPAAEILAVCKDRLLCI